MFFILIVQYGNGYAITYHFNYLIFPTFYLNMHYLLVFARSLCVHGNIKIKSALRNQNVQLKFTLFLNVFSNT